MDPLSQILSLLKPRSYITAGFDAGGDWSLLLDDLAGRIKCYAVLRGTCWLAHEGGEEAVRLVAGDCFVLPSGCAVRIGSDPTLTPTLSSEALTPDQSGGTVTYNGGGDVLLVGSRFDISGRHAAVLLQSLPPIIHLEGAADQSTLRWSIELMMQELRDAKAGSALIAQQLAHMMLVQTLRLHLVRQTGAGTGWFAALTDPRLGRALGALHADPAHGWTLQRLAGEAGMSRSVFARKFRATLGETPLSYLTRWRMVIAADRLAASQEPLRQVANAVGYESENAFNTAFRRVMGMAPRRFARIAEHTRSHA
ncbi:AraC-like DNA-binding protein [Sphingomonas zeicaulis]|uniref:AraC family transcriptional regulator n=1 Tax=Sphingomonas zeicaulis TaxID=1632740 RepID=UPI003D24133F